MSLRTRLTMAFFAISVIPLSAVTFYSYISSERALRRAAEQQAATMAAELGRRMEWVTSDLGRRMDRVWPMPDLQRLASAAASPRAAGTTAPARSKPRPDRPAQPATPTAPPADVSGHLAQVLGDIAPMIESLEITPRSEHRVPAAKDAPHATAPPVPDVPDAPVPPAPGPTGAEAAAGIETGRKVVVEMSEVIEKAMEPYRTKGSPSQAEIIAWSKAMQERLRQVAASQAATVEDQRRLAQQVNEDLQEAREELERFKEGQAKARAQGASPEASRAQGAKPEASGTTTGSAHAAGPAAGTRADTAFVQVKGPDVNSLFRRDGQEVGRIHARLNMPRVFRTIVPTRRDQGEVAFAITPDGKVQAPDSDRAAIEELEASHALPTGDTTVRSGPKWVVVTRKGPGGMTFGTARPLGRDLAELRGVAARNFGMGFGLIALVFVASVPLAAGMTRNLRTLMHGVQQVAQGNLDARVAIRSRDEFGKLAEAFNGMAAGLREHEQLVVRQERLRRELELCRQIQNEMLPREGLRLGLAEVKGISIPAREVGGDFFNYFVLPGGDIALLLGDVSGKGVGAALLMANVQATLRARLPLSVGLARLVEELDRELHASTPPEVYLTMFVGVVTPGTRLLRYVNAGHNTQFVLGAGATLERMPSTGRPLGLLPGGGYEERSIHLGPGDLLFFYTDGMVEAENEAGEQFGSERLEVALRDAAASGTGVDDMLGRVEDTVRAFRGRVELADDATMMALRLESDPTASSVPA